MKKIIQFSTVQGNYNIALLILRVWMGISLFVDHGIEKLNFNQMAQHFPDPLHIGVVPGLAFAFIADVICSILVALGLFTRIAALLIVINLFVAFAFFHKLDITDPFGQVAYIYLGSYLAILVAGPGKYSLDSALFKNSNPL
jgi:putative oxidoreductase